MAPWNSGGNVMKKIAGIIFALSMVAASAAWAQCAVNNKIPSLQPGGNVFGATYSQWQQFFAAKADGNNGQLCSPNITGTPTFNGLPIPAFQPIANGTVLGNASGATAPAYALSAVTLGIQQTSPGSLTLANVAAGAWPATIQSSPSATAALTLTLPPAPPAGNGYAIVWSTAGVGSFENIGTGPFLPLTGGTLTGELITAASVTGNSGLNLPQGIAPASPANGDVWMTSAGLFAHAGGSTVGPLNTGVTSVNALTGAITLSEALNCSNCGLAYSASSNNATFSLTDAAGNTPSSSHPVEVCFPAPTATAGKLNCVSIQSSLSVTLNANSTLGVPGSSANAFNVWLGLVYNSGSPALAVETATNYSTGAVQKPEEGTSTTTTACNACTSATAAQTWYSTTSVSGTVKVIGFAQLPAWATAGNWGAATSVNVCGIGCAKPGDTVQHVQGSTTSATANTTTAYVNTNLTVSITPLSAADLMVVKADGDIITTSGFGGFETLSNGSACTNTFGSTTEAAGTTSQVTTGTPVMGQNFPASVSAQSYYACVKSSSATEGVVFNNTTLNKVMLVDEIRT